MPDREKFEIFAAYPPGREGQVAELNVRHDGTIDIPDELHREDGETMITLSLEAMDQHGSIRSQTSLLQSTVQ